MEYRNIKELKKLPNNPRLIKDDSFKKLVQSIQDNPDYFEARPIILSDRSGELIIIAGNQRYDAAKHLKLEKVPTFLIKNLNEEREKEIIIRDNINNGEWDYNILEDWNIDNLKEWDLDVKIMQKKLDIQNAKWDILVNKYIIPPFSILDSRQPYWQERKKNWKLLIDDKGESRENTLSGSNNSHFSVGSFTNGVSILDPILAEITNLWFGFENCKIIDPFAGDSVFGYVSSFLGNSFTGIELRKEQADINNIRIKDFPRSKYICDDGQNIGLYIEENSQDLLFSCPPYFDLEKYSDLYTSLYLLGESHFAIHTFPEENSTYIELVSCVKDKFDNFLKNII